MNDIVFIKGLNACKEKDWAAFERAAHYDAETAARLLKFSEEEIPGELKCRISLYHYDHHGDSFPIIRKYVRMALPYRPDNWREDLPEPVRDLQNFTVYRAGSEPIKKAKYSISWTLFQDVAEWFAERHEYYTPEKQQHIYRGTISADKVISYINGRNEFEIVQYRHVKSIEEIPRAGISPEFMKLHNEPDRRRSYEPHNDPMELYFNRWCINSNQNN